MKSILITPIIVLFLPICLWGQTFNNFKPKNYWLGITAEAPPAMMWVADSQGRRAGADPGKSVDQNGIQGDGLHGLEEIPASVTDQQNIQNDSTGQPQPRTLWSVSIPDGGPNTYTLNLKGIVSGTCYVGIHVGSNSSKNSNNYFGVFVTPNSVKQLNVSFDTNHLTTTVQRVAENGDLLADVKTACYLNEITSSRVCKRLEKQAKAIQDALDHHHYEEAGRLIWVFLHSLGDSRPEGCKDDDDHSAVQEPALTILKEDAKALLAQVEKEEPSPHGDHDHGGDNAR